MAFWDLDHIKSICGGQWLARPDIAERVAPSGLSTDTRTLQAGEAFLALRGESMDGNAFLKDAIAKGAVLAIIDRAEAIKDPGVALPRTFAVLHVQDGGQALLKLAAAYRKHLDSTKVVAVAGSNGKTTTTKLIAGVLAKGLRGTASKKSFNNAIGVPLTILSAKRGDQYLVCEVGTNSPGEIAVLGKVLQPDVVVMTSLGREHLEGLGSLEGVAREEASLLDSMRAGGLAVITADAPAAAQRILDEKAKAGVRTVVRFGVANDADLRITACEATPDGTRFCLNERAWHATPLVGRHNAANATAAIAVARRFGIEPALVDAALGEASGAPMRLERTSACGVAFLNDAYNSNPDSAIAALRAFDETFPAGVAGGLARRRRVVVLGDMLELGQSGDGGHRDVGMALAATPGVDLAILVGPLSASTLAAARDGGTKAELVHVPDYEPASIRRVGAMLAPGDCVLLKGSRRVALERVIEVVRERERVEMGPRSARLAPARA